jgi:hypothetical protein
MLALRAALVLALMLAAAWLCFDNVFSENSDVQALAERAACATHKCEEPHRLTDERRVPWEQTFEYAWNADTVRVTCRRVYIVIGDRICTVE